ncbi:hypothetical protein HK405_011937, partial [Cladochytrium tenue]
VPTLFVAECVLVYLPAATTVELLRWCAAEMQSCYLVTYEQINPEDAFGRVMVENLRSRNLHLPGLHAFPTAESHAQRCVSAGFSGAAALTMRQFYAERVAPDEADRVRRLELLDELEEWLLMADHYCVAWAWAGGGGGNDGAGAEWADGVVVGGGGDGEGAGGGGGAAVEPSSAAAASGRANNNPPKQHTGFFHHKLKPVVTSTNNSHNGQNGNNHAGPGYGGGGGGLTSPLRSFFGGGGAHNGGPSSGSPWQSPSSSATSRQKNTKDRPANPNSPDPLLPLPLPPGQPPQPLPQPARQAAQMSPAPPPLQRPPSSDKVLPQPQQPRPQILAPAVPAMQRPQQRDAAYPRDAHSPRPATNAVAIPRVPSGDFTAAAASAGNSGNWDIKPFDPARGRLWINVVEARHLLVRSNDARPYCVVEFEKNEFVTKEAVALTASAPDGSDDRGFSPVWKHEATFDVARPDGEVTITLWDRAGVVPGEGEAFLGMMKIRPPRINGKLHDNWFRLLPRQWKEKVKGDLHIQLVYRAIE